MLAAVPVLRIAADARVLTAPMPLQVARIPTFQVIILQGILGSTPWNALVFLTRYLQLIGFSNLGASLAVSCFQGGAALGGVVGGVIGDWAAKRNANHGRILACQFSVFMGIPFSLLVIKGLPLNGEGGTVALYCLTLFVFGLMHVWAAPACNNPVFAEIVPPELRNLVYAFDRCARAVTQSGSACVHVALGSVGYCLACEPLEGGDLPATVRARCLYCNAPRLPGFTHAGPHSVLSLQIFRGRHRGAGRAARGRYRGRLVPLQEGGRCMPGRQAAGAGRVAKSRQRGRARQRHASVHAGAVGAVPPHLHVFALDVPQGQGGSAPTARADAKWSEPRFHAQPALAD